MPDIRFVTFKVRAGPDHFLVQIGSAPAQQFDKMKPALRYLLSVLQGELEVERYTLEQLDEDF